MQFCLLLTTGLMTELALLAASILLFWIHAGNTIAAVQSGSMVPTFNKGDAVIVQKQRPVNLRPGDIVTYTSSTGKHPIISHRLVDINLKNNAAYTKGDHLPQIDPVVNPWAIKGKVVAIVPRCGLIINWLHKPIGLLLATYVPALVIIAYEIRRMAVSYEQLYLRS